RWSVRLRGDDVYPLQHEGPGRGVASDPPRSETRGDVRVPRARTQRRRARRPPPGLLQPPPATGCVRLQHQPTDRRAHSRGRSRGPGPRALRAWGYSPDHGGDVPGDCPADGVMNLEGRSRWSGESAEQLLEWRSLGLIGGGRDDFRPEDVERARLIRFLLRRGIRLEAIVKADREQDVLASHVRAAFASGVGRSYTPEDAAGIVGLDLATVRRFWRSMGFGGQGERLYEEDVQALKTLKVALDAGFPEEALLQLARVWADALGRIAEAEVRLFHFYVHERLKAGGLAGRELVEASNASGDRMRPLIEPVLLYFHQKGMEQAAREDIVLHVQEEAGFEGTAEVPAQLRAAVLFVDLSSFTPLTEAMGDAAAAEVLARFSQLVREAV